MESSRGAYGFRGSAMNALQPKEVSPDEQTPYGRGLELNRLLEWVAEGPALVRLQGAPGVGKTHLLRLLARQLERQGMPVSWLNANLIPPDPRRMRDLLEQLPDSSEADPALLIIDNFDAHQRMERVYWTELLPTLCPYTRVVLSSAGELEQVRAPSPEHQVSLLALKPLDREQGAAFLAHNGVPEKQHEMLVQFTGGLPLLLTTLVEFASQNNDPTWLSPDPRRSPVETVLSHVLREAPSDEHRHALWASAMPRVLSERLLAGMLDHPRSNESFRWLRTRRYINQGPEGLAIHSVFRGPLMDDLMLRAPHLYREFLLRAGRFFIARTTGQKRPEQRIAAGAAHFYVERRQYPLSTHLSALSDSVLYVDDARPSDEADLDAIVSAHEGDDGIRLARHWRAERPELLRVFRRADARVQSFVHALRLEAVERDDSRRDPVMACARQVLQARERRRRRTRAHGRQRSYRQPALVFRFWLDRERGQTECLGRTEILQEMLMQTLSEVEPSLVLFISPRADINLTNALEDVGLVRHFEGGRGTLDGQPFELVGHDFVDEPLEQWMRRALTTAISGPRRRGRETQGRGGSMNRNDFQHAVVEALEDYFDDRALARNPLGERLSNYTELPVQGRIQRWLMDGVSQLAHMPGGEDYAAQLRDHYLESAPIGRSRDIPAGRGRDDNEGLIAAIQLLVATLWDSQGSHWNAV